MNKSSLYKATQPEFSGKYYIDFKGAKVMLNRASSRPKSTAITRGRKHILELNYNNIPTGPDLHANSTSNNVQ